MSLITYAVKVAKILNGLGLRYALVGGLACILMGVRRMTEDADFIVEAGSPDDVERLFLGLREAGFDASLEDMEEAYADGGHFTILVDGYRLDFKFASSTLDIETLERAVEVEVAGEKMRIARLEESIAAKITILSSLQDVEDALWLMINYRDEIDWDRLRQLVNGDPGKLIKGILSEFEREFGGNKAVSRRLSELKSLLKLLP